MLHLGFSKVCLMAYSKKARRFSFSMGLKELEPLKVEGLSLPKGFEEIPGFV